MVKIFLESLTNQAHHVCCYLQESLYRANQSPGIVLAQLLDQFTILSNNKLFGQGNMKSEEIEQAKGSRAEGRSTNGCFVFPPMPFIAFHQRCEKDYCESPQPSRSKDNEAKEVHHINNNHQRMIAINIHCLYGLLSSRQKHHQGQQTRMADKLLQLLFGQIQGQQENNSPLIHSYLIKVANLFQIILTISAHRRAIDSIIDRFHEQNLEDCIQHITEIPATISINNKQMYDLVRTVQRRQREIMVQLNLTKLGGKRLNQAAKQVTSCQQNSSLGIEVKELELFAGMLRSKGSDLMALKMEWPRMCKSLTSVLSNWKMYEYDCGPLAKELIQLLEYKYCKFRIKLLSKNQEVNEFYLLDYLCPKLSYIVTAFNSLFKNKGLRDTLEEKPKQGDITKENEAYSSALKEVKAELKIDQNVLDKLTVDYFAELQSISKGTGSFFVKIDGFQKKPLKEFIGEIIQCQQLSFHWDDIFNIITINALKTIQSPNKEQNLQLITRSKYPDPSCLGCAQFFLFNKSIINSYNNTPIRIFPDLSFNLVRYQLLEQLCYMLNSKGGVIFFSCARQYGSILPKGAYIKKEGREAKKKELIQIVEKFIQPKVDIARDVVVSFVPIAQNVRQKGSQEIKLQAIQDAFVMRIKVCSYDKSISYFCPELDYRKKERDPPSQNTRQSPYRSSTFRNPLNHACKDVSSFQQFEAIDKIFNHMSMVVVKQEHADQLLKILQQHLQGCHIQFKFQDYGFSIAKYTAVMYHNESFEKVLDIVNQHAQKFSFQGKKVLVIYITEYLKIQMPEKLNNKDLQNAILWLRKQFPTQALKYYNLKKPKEQERMPEQGPQLQEYYIKTQSKLSTLYMYYVFNHFKVKTVFKDPPISQRDNLEEVKQND